MQQVGISREQIAEQPVPVFTPSDGKTSSVNGPEDLENVDLPGKMAITFKINVASHLPKQAQEADPSDIANANDLQAVNVVEARRELEPQAPHAVDVENDPKPQVVEEIFVSG